jgi:hypothetical protein
VKWFTNFHLASQAGFGAGYQTLRIGFSFWRGGNLRWADSIGMANLVDKLKKYEPPGKRFEATDQMREAAEGKGFFAP